ncbi:MAG TPA: hypothetical protein VF944_09400 [Candidatus Bathyarchaeia archaeon]
MLKNSTDIPDKLIAIAVAFGMPQGMSKEAVQKIVVKNKRRGKTHGRWGWYYPGDQRIVVIVPRVISRPHTFPRPYSRRRIIISSRAEFLVTLLAHEMRHAWQYENWRTPNMLWRLDRSSVAKYAREVDAELWESEVLERWKHNLMFND